MEVTHEIKEVRWLNIFCLEIQFEQQPMRLDCDIQSAIFLAKNPTYHSKTNHIDVQYHFVGDTVERKKVLLEKFDNLQNVADSFTKSIRTEKFSWCTEAMGIHSLDC